uniref:Uncharacterized protein n=1 Tax=mine drainage metagenome TaxID=410659 RepID=E6QIV6_9ZZZZ
MAIESTITAQAGIMGASVARIYGPMKTTCTAQYDADFHFPYMAHAVPVSIEDLLKSEIREA